MKTNYDFSSIQATDVEDVIDAVSEIARCEKSRENAEALIEDWFGDSQAIHLKSETLQTAYIDGELIEPSDEQRSEAKAQGLTFGSYQETFKIEIIEIWYEDAVDDSVIYVNVTRL